MLYVFTINPLGLFILQWGKSSISPRFNFIFLRWGDNCPRLHYLGFLFCNILFIYLFDMFVGVVCMGSIGTHSMVGVQVIVKLVGVSSFVPLCGLWAILLAPEFSFCAVDKSIIPQNLPWFRLTINPLYETWLLISLLVLFDIFIAFVSSYKC